MRDSHTSLDVDVQNVLELLSSSSLDEVARGLRLIGERGYSELSSHIFPFLQDSRYYELRVMSVRSCGLLRLSDALPDLHLLAIDDDYEEVRREAVLALGLIQTSSSLPFLYQCLTDEDEGVRENALIVLKDWADRGEVLRGLSTIAKDPTKPIVFRREALSALIQLADSSLFQLFLSFLDHEDKELSRLAVDGLGVLGDPRGVPYLRDFLDDDDDDFRLSVYSALGRIVSSESVSLLKKGMLDPYDYIRQEIARCMSQFSSDDALPILATLIKDEVAFVRSDAVRSLSSFSGSEVIELLSKAIADPNASVRKEVAYSLGFQGLASIELVNELLRDDDDLVRIAAENALRRIDTGG